MKTYKNHFLKPSLNENENNLIFFSKLFNNVEYFIFFGTLLGITRENSLIEGDDDIDFYVNSKDRDQLISNLIENNINVDLNLSVNKNKSFLQVKRESNSKNLITDFYFYEKDLEKNYIIEKWNFEGGTKDVTKHLRIPKIFIFPLKKKDFKSTQIFLPKEQELLCEFLYGRFWQKKFKKDQEYTIKVINGKPNTYLIKTKFFMKKLILSE